MVKGDGHSESEPTGAESISANGPVGGSAPATSSDLIAYCNALIARSPRALAALEGPEHLFRYVNTAFAQLVGQTRQLLLGRPFAEAFPASRTDDLLVLLDRVSRTGTAERLPELEWSHSVQDSRFWSCAIWPVEGNGGRPAIVIVEIDDITEEIATRHTLEETDRQMREVNERLIIAGVREQELAEEAERSAAELRKVYEQLVVAGVREQELAEEAERYSAELSALLGSINDGVAVIDREGQLVLVNPEGRRILLLSPEEKLPLADELHQIQFLGTDGVPLPPDRAPFARALRGDRFAAFELVLVRSDQSRLRIAFNGSSIRTGSGQIIFALLVFRDVTELRRLEEVKEEFVALISHDLRSPLNVIIGYAQILEQTPLLERWDKAAGQIAAITRSAWRMDAMIRDLLESTRLESGEFELHKQPRDLRQLIEETVQSLSPEDQARIQIETAGSIPPMPVDRDRLDRVVVNLLTNALKFSPPESPVTVRIEQHDGVDGAAVVSVIDRGSGIPPEDLSRIFERFLRTKTGTGAEGLGLGLYIARLIVEAHGGRIWAESEPGKGSIFEFTLPVHTEPV